jgi:hypothetical protein
VPATAQYEEYLTHMRSFPLIAKPTLCGLNENIALLRGKEEAFEFFNKIVATQVNLM